MWCMNILTVSHWWRWALKTWVLYKWTDWLEEKLVGYRYILSRRQFLGRRTHAPKLLFEAKLWLVVPRIYLTWYTILYSYQIVIQGSGLVSIHFEWYTFDQRFDKVYGRFWLLGSTFHITAVLLTWVPIVHDSSSYFYSY